MCRWFAGFKISVMRFVVRLWITVVCSHIVDARSEPQFLTACRVWNYFVSRKRMFDHLFTLESVCWEHFSVSQSRGTLSVTNAKELFRLVHILAIAYVSPLTAFRPTLLTVHTKTHATYSKTMRQWSKLPTKGRSPDRESIWMDVGATEFVSFYFDKNTCGQTISWRIFRQRMFATMQWHSWLTLRQIRRPYSSHEVSSFSRKPFSCSALAKPQAMSQEMFTCRVWKEIRLHSGYSLHLGAIEQPWVLHVQKTRNVFLQECSSPWVWREQESKYKRWNDYLEQNRKSARRIDGVRFHIFLGAKTNETVLKNRWMDQTRSRWIWTTFYPRNLSSSSSYHGNDEQNFDFFKGAERGDAPFLQDPERNAAYFGKFNPGYFMVTIPTPHKPHLSSWAPSCFRSTMCLKSRL